MAHDKQQRTELEKEIQNFSSKVAREASFKAFLLGKTEIDIGTQKL